jgi:hypothetical protein
LKNLQMSCYILIITYQNKPHVCNETFLDE